MKKEWKTPEIKELSLEETNGASIHATGENTYVAS